VRPGHEGTGNGHSFGGKYLELVAGERIRLHGPVRRSESARRDGDDLALREVSCGTELNVVQEGLPEVIPVEACYLGWQESLEHLARLVEPKIPD
jgi:uncharacterized protein YndB with AHSA1/START domain